MKKTRTNRVRAISNTVGARGADIVAIYEGVNTAYTKAKEYWRNNFSYTVTVSERDPLYNEVFSWLIDAMPEERHRALTVSSSNSYDDHETSVPSSPGDVAKPKKLTVRFNETSTRHIQLGPHKISVALRTSSDSVPSGGAYHMPPPSKIEFLTTSHAAQKAVVQKLEEINASRTTARKAALRLVSSWGSWMKRGDLPPRNMASVSLPVDQKNRIIEDLRTFLDAEDQYNRLAIPWHRGYMFHGPPGTGKTSLAKALANEFNLDIWYISLSDLKAESSLIGLLSEVGPRSILLLEDIDTIRITHDRDSSEPGTISMSALLNTLDGVATPHGLITIMSTNRFELLDSALTRAGRMDLVEKIDHPTITTILQMFRHFYGEVPVWEVDGDMDEPLTGVSTAQVSEILKQHMTDIHQASHEVYELLVTQKTSV